MAYQIVGRYKGRKYRSRAYRTEDAALRAGYAKTYKKDGDTKRKASASLTDWHIEKV